MNIKTLHIPAGGGFDHVSIGTTQPVAPGPGEIIVRPVSSSLDYHDCGVAVPRWGRRSGVSQCPTA